MPHPSYSARSLASASVLIIYSSRGDSGERLSTSRPTHSHSPTMGDGCVAHWRGFSRASFPLSSLVGWGRGEELRMYVCMRGCARSRAWVKLKTTFRMHHVYLIKSRRTLHGVNTHIHTRVHAYCRSSLILHHSQHTHSHTLAQHTQWELTHLKCVCVCVFGLQWVSS